MQFDFELIQEWYIALAPYERAVWIGIPFVVIVLRRWIADGFIAVLSAALRRFGITPPEPFRDGVRPAMAGLVVMIAIYVSVAVVDLQTGLRMSVLTVLQSMIVFCVFWLLNQSAQMLIGQGRGDALGVDDEFL
ncbi:MAG: hypothetical protein AAF626_18945, partial [Pseudomonadota bacterium]